MQCNTLSFLLFPLALALAAPLNAQSEQQLLADPNIVWVAEHFADYRLIEHYGSHETKLQSSEWNRLAVMKLLNKPRRDEFSALWDVSPFMWQHVINKWLRSADLQAFSDPLLKHPLNGEHFSYLSKLDTVETVDPATYETRIYMTVSEMNTEDFVGMRVRQVVYWDALNNELGCLATAYSPLVINYGDNDVTVAPLFWMPIEQQPDAESTWHDDAFPLIMETWSKKSSVRLENTTNLKGVCRPAQFLSSALADRNKVLWSSDGQSILQELERNALAASGGSIDTIETFDPITFASTINIVEHPPLDLNDLASLRTIMCWYWNDEKQKLSYNYIGWGPAMNKRDAQGDIRYSQYLFYDIKR